MNDINLKNIHIGKLIEIRWKELGIPIERTINFFKTTEEEIYHTFTQEYVSIEILLKWCKLLEYDFFRLFSQHLILYSPSSSGTNKKKKKESALPIFRKNLYTQDMIDFLLELVNSKEKTITQIINEYKIPKTTFYKWIKKY